MKLSFKMKYYYADWRTQYKVKCYDTDTGKECETQLRGIIHDNKYCISTDRREITFLDTCKTMNIYFTKGTIYILHDTLFYRKNNKIILYSIKNYKLVEIKRIFEKFPRSNVHWAYDCMQFWYADSYYTKITKEGTLLSYPYFIRYLNLDYDVVIYDNSMEVRRFSTGEIIAKKAFLGCGYYCSTDDCGNVYFTYQDKKLSIFSLPTFELLHEAKLQSCDYRMHKNFVFYLDN